MTRKQFSTRLNPLTINRLDLMNNKYGFGKGRLIDRAIKILFTVLKETEDNSSLDKDRIMSFISAIVDEIQEGE